MQPAVPSLEPVDVYLGIPYAEKPLGANRFMMPRTPARWTGRTKVSPIFTSPLHIGLG